MNKPVIIVHGGAWTIPEDLINGSRDGTKRAARAGYHVLKKGGSAVDAVQTAVCVLEDDPCFDAGCGSVLNLNGEVEMDSVIMDGRTLNTGAVACVHNIQNPIKLARAVMDKTDHCLLVGKGANQFADEIGIKTVPTESLVSEEAIRELACFKQYGNTVESLFRQRNTGHDTVGAVAIDIHGNIAFGTSTGGISCKKPGRVGDSPIVGAGGYADNEVGGVSCTGHGESISKVVLAHHITTLMRQGAGGYADNEVGGVSCTGHGESISKVVLAHHIITLMRQGLSAQQASDKALDNMASRVHGYGGVIVIDNHGNVAKSFTTERMAWAWAKDGVLHHGVNVGEDITENVNVDNNDNEYDINK